jgi:flagellar motor switch protein FliM
VGDILSQNEIDRLLQQLNTGELDSRSSTRIRPRKRYVTTISGARASLLRIISAP